MPLTKFSTNKFLNRNVCMTGGRLPILTETPGIPSDCAAFDVKVDRGAGSVLEKSIENARKGARMRVVQSK